MNNGKITLLVLDYVEREQSNPRLSLEARAEVRQVAQLFASGDNTEDMVGAAVTDGTAKYIIDLFSEFVGLPTPWRAFETEECGAVWLGWSMFVCAYSELLGDYLPYDHYEEFLGAFEHDN